MFFSFLSNEIAMFRVMSPFVINVPTRDLLVAKRSFQIMVGTLALQLQCL